jgi:hypothetical protein
MPTTGQAQLPTGHATWQGRNARSPGVIIRVTPVRQQAVCLFKGASAYGRLNVADEGRREDLGTHATLRDYRLIGCLIRVAGLRHGQYLPGQEEDGKGSETGWPTSLGCAKGCSLDLCQRRRAGPTRVWDRSTRDGNPTDTTVSTISAPVANRLRRPVVPGRPILAGDQRCEARA